MAGSASSSWVSQNETLYELYADRALYDGAQLGTFAQGVQTIIALLTIKTLLRAHKSRARLASLLVVYVATICMLATIGNACDIKMSELAWVDNHDYPGGPSAFILEANIRIDFVGLVAHVLASWMQDGFMLYRYMAIYGWKWYLILVPACVYVLTILSSILMLVQLDQGAGQLFSRTTVNFALMYWSSSVVNILLLTLLIVGKLMYVRCQLKSIFGAEHMRNTPYLSLSAMLIESALLYSIFAVAFLTLYARNNPFQNIFLPALGQVQVIAPELIILRVAQGKSFTSTSFCSKPTSAMRKLRSDTIHVTVDVEVPNIRTPSSDSQSDSHTAHSERMEHKGEDAKMGA